MRPLAFYPLLGVWTIALGMLFLPWLMVPRRYFRRPKALWLDGTLLLVRHVLGIRWTIEGSWPQEPLLVACQHQSALETFLLARQFPDAAFVLKRELLWVPIFGWYLAKTAPVAIDRRAGIRSLRRLAASDVGGRTVVIFPEGTRCPPDQPGRLHPGVALLAGILQRPVLPVRLDTGRCWPKNIRRMRPGRVRLEVCPALRDTDGRMLLEKLAHVYRRLDSTF